MWAYATSTFHNFKRLKFVFELCKDYLHLRVQNFQKTLILKDKQVLSVLFTLWKMNSRFLNLFLLLLLLLMSDLSFVSLFNSFIILT